MCWYITRRFAMQKNFEFISGDEAVSVDDQEEAEHLVAKRRCPKCDLSMDNYLLDENHNVCSNNLIVMDFQLKKAHLNQRI